MSALGRLLVRAEDWGARIVERAEDAAETGFLGRKFPRVVDAMERAVSFATADTERVECEFGELDVNRSVGLSLSSSAAALAGVLHPGALTFLPAGFTAGGLVGGAIAGVALASPYLLAAAGQGIAAALHTRSGEKGSTFGEAARRTIVKNLQLAALQVVPFVGFLGSMTALASQLKHRAMVRREGHAEVLAGINAALENAKVEYVQFDAKGEPIFSV